MTYITGRQNTGLLDRLLSESKREDEDEARRQREQNEAAYLKAVRRWFGVTDEGADGPL